MCRNSCGLIVFDVKEVSEISAGQRVGCSDALEQRALTIVLENRVDGRTQRISSIVACEGRDPRFGWNDGNGAVRPAIRACPACYKDFFSRATIGSLEPSGGPIEPQELTWNCCVEPGGSGWNCQGHAGAPRRNCIWRTWIDFPSNGSRAEYRIPEFVADCPNRVA